MKIELLGAAAALAAGVSAVPLRIITLTGPAPHLAPAEVAHGLPRHEGEMRIMPHPCPGKMKSGASPFGDLLARLGFASPPFRPDHHGYDHGHPDIFIKHAVPIPDHYEGKKEEPGEKGNMMIEGWKHHVDEMFGKILPIMEGGEVKILPVFDQDPEHEHEHPHPHSPHRGSKKYGGPGGHLRPHGGHHWRHKGSDFGSRLHRAMMHLSAPEAITLAFVLGAGIGSIMHLVFMLFLISIRRLRGGRAGHRSHGCEVWRAERQKRKEARRAAKAAKREGRLRLDDSNTHSGGEVLPSYAEGEGDRLVEKA